MSNTSEKIAATLRRIASEARALDSYQTGFVTQSDISRVSTDLTRLLAVLAIADPARLEEPEDTIELRERLNIVRADIAALLVSVQNLHDKVEAIDATMNALENLVDSEEDVL